VFGGKALKEALGGEGAGSRGRAGGGNRFCRSTVKTLWVAAVALWCGTPECVRPWGNAGAPRVDAAGCQCMHVCGASHPLA
jgi:hypothetical protein